MTVPTHSRWTHLGSYHALLQYCADLDRAYVAGEDREILEAAAANVCLDAEDGFKVGHLALLLRLRETHDGLNLIPSYSTSTDPLHQATWDAQVYLDGKADEMLDELQEAVADARKLTGPVLADAMQVAA